MKLINLSIILIFLQFTNAGFFSHVWHECVDIFHDVTNFVEDVNCDLCIRLQDEGLWGSTIACIAAGGPVAGGICAAIAGIIEGKYEGNLPDPLCDNATGDAKEACWRERCEYIGYCPMPPIIDCKLTMQHATQCNEDGDIKFLDRHHVGSDCGDNEVLSAWQVTQCGCEQGQFRVQYNCVAGNGVQTYSGESTRDTECAIPYDGQVNNLDRSPVNMQLYDTQTDIYGYQPLFIQSFQMFHPCGEQNSEAFKVYQSKAATHAKCLNAYTPCISYDNEPISYLKNQTLNCAQFGADYGMTGFQMQESTTSDASGFPGPACDAGKFRFRYQCCALSNNKAEFDNVGAGDCGGNQFQMSTSLQTFDFFGNCENLCHQKPECEAFTFTPKYGTAPLPACWGYTEPCTFSKSPCLAGNSCQYNRAHRYYYAGKDACANTPDITALSNAPHGIFNSSHACEKWCTTDDDCGGFDSSPISSSADEQVFCTFYDGKCKMSSEACDQMAVGCSWNKFQDTPAPTKAPTSEPEPSNVSWKLGEPGHSCVVTCGLDHLMPQTDITRSIRSTQFGKILNILGGRTNYCNSYHTGFGDNTALPGAMRNTSYGQTTAITVDDLTPFLQFASTDPTKSYPECYGTNQYYPNDVWSYEPTNVPYRTNNLSAPGVQRLCACVPPAKPTIVAWDSNGQPTITRTYGESAHCKCDGCGDGIGRDLSGQACNLPTLECNPTAGVSTTGNMCYGMLTGEWSFLSTACNCGTGTDIPMQTVAELKTDCVANLTATEALCTGDETEVNEVAISPAVWGGNQCGTYTCPGSASTQANVYGASADNYGAVQSSVHAAAGSYYGVDSSDVSSSIDNSRRILHSSDHVRVILTVKTSKAMEKNMQNRLDNTNHARLNEIFQEKLAGASIHGDFRLHHISVSFDSSDDDSSDKYFQSILTVNMVSMIMNGFLVIIVVFLIAYQLKCNNAAENVQLDSEMGDVEMCKRRTPLE